MSNNFKLVGGLSDKARNKMALKHLNLLKKAGKEKDLNEYKLQYDYYIHYNDKRNYDHYIESSKKGGTPTKMYVIAPDELSYYYLSTGNMPNKVVNKEKPKRGRPKKEVPINTIVVPVTTEVVAKRKGRPKKVLTKKVSPKIVSKPVNMTDLRDSYIRPIIQASREVPKPVKVSRPRKRATATIKYVPIKYKDIKREAKAIDIAEREKKKADIVQKKADRAKIKADKAQIKANKLIKPIIPPKPLRMKPALPFKSIRSRSIANIPPKIIPVKPDYVRKKAEANLKRAKTFIANNQRTEKNKGLYDRYLKYIR